jgi:uncharacterized integral membrane protein
MFKINFFRLFLLLLLLLLLLSQLRDAVTMARWKWEFNIRLIDVLFSFWHAFWVGFLNDY